MDSLLAIVQKEYGLSSALLVRKAKGGYLSQNFIVSDRGTKYFLKQYRPKLRTRIGAIHAAKQFFAAGDIPVILPLQTKNGSTYVTHGESVYALFPFVVSGVVRDPARLTLVQVRSLATILARMHLLSQKRLPNIDAPTLPAWTKAYGKELAKRFWETTERILLAIAKKRHKTTFDRAAEKLVRQKQVLVAGVPEIFDTKTLGKPHVSHGDFHAENVFFSKQGVVTHVFDFEKFEIFPRSLELFRSLHLICFGDGFSEKNFRKGREYLKAYNAVYPIKRSEFAVAVHYSRYRQVFGTWVEAEHYLHNNTRADIFLRSDARAVTYFSVHTNDFINRVWPE